MKTAKEIKELPFESGMTPNEKKNDWWLHYLIVSYYDDSKVLKRESKVWDGDSLKYCPECDKVWEFGNRVYDKFYNFRKRVFYSYGRDVLSFYGFKNVKDKHKICIKCRERDRDENN